MPASKVAVIDTGSISISRSMSVRSSVTTDLNPPDDAVTPPTTLVPPPNGTTAMPSSAAACSAPSTSSGLRG